MVRDHNPHWGCKWELINILCHECHEQFPCNRRASSWSGSFSVYRGHAAWDLSSKLTLLGCHVIHMNHWTVLSEAFLVGKGLATLRKYIRPRSQASVAPRRIFHNFLHTWQNFVNYCHSQHKCCRFFHNNKPSHWLVVSKLSLLLY